MKCPARGAVVGCGGGARGEAVVESLGPDACGSVVGWGWGAGQPPVDAPLLVAPPKSRNWYLLFTAPAPSHGLHRSDVISHW